MISRYLILIEHEPKTIFLLIIDDGCPIFVAQTHYYFFKIKYTTNLLLINSLTHRRNILFTKRSLISYILKIYNFIFY